MIPVIIQIMIPIIQKSDPILVVSRELSMNKITTE